MNSGIEVPDEALKAVKDIDKSKNRYVILKPSENGAAVEIQKIGNNMEEGFDEFKASIEP